MVVVAIVGILATIAIPSYRDYTIRSKITEGIAHINKYKTVVEEYYNIKGVLPPADYVGMGTHKTGDMTGEGNVFLTNHPSISRTHVFRGSDTDMRLVVVLRTDLFPDSVTSTVTDPRISLVTKFDSSGNLSWTCATSPNAAIKVPYKYLPPSCRNMI